MHPICKLLVFSRRLFASTVAAIHARFHASCRNFVVQVFLAGFSLSNRLLLRFVRNKIPPCYDFGVEADRLDANCKQDLLHFCRIYKLGKQLISILKFQFVLPAMESQVVRN